MRISKKATTIAIVNQKGGTGKTTTCENLGIGLAMEGKKVLLVDADPQGSLTISMGWKQPDELPTTLSTLMAKAMNDQSIPPGEGILHHAEGVDLIPANIELAGLEVSLVNCMNREKMLKQVLDSAKHDYDFILLDCTPSLGMLTVNALAAADTTLIPVQAQYLSAKGLEQLLQTVQKVRRQINPKLKIEGILLTMTDSRTNYGKQISNLIRQAYGKHLKVFEQTIPRSVRAAETSAAGKSILLHTEKPPYRFPHTAADCLFAEQVAVCAGAGQRQHQNIIFYAVDKQPVRENVTFPMACPIAGQVMVTVLIWQRFAHRQQRYDLLQQLDLQATLDGSFVVFFETGRVLDGIFGFFHLFRSANNSSRSL